MKIKGILSDALGAFRVSSVYKKAISSASTKNVFPDPIGDLAKKLHPGPMSLRLIERTKIVEGVFFLTFEGVDKAIPLFKPGQFMTLSKRIGASVLTRAYTICSDYRKRDSISILIKKMGGPMTEALSTCPLGETFLSEIGLGPFYYEPLRDSKNVVVLVGGSGVTPAIAMGYDSKEYDLTILYCVNSESEILLKEQLEEFAKTGARVVYIIRDGSKTIPCEKGLITAEIIAKYMGEDPTFFVCGPAPMLETVGRELEKLHIPSRRIRMETPSVNVSADALPTPAKEICELTLHIGKSLTMIPARSDETLLTAFERAGIFVHNACRSGACGYCRVKVLSGEFFYAPTSDGRRHTDKELNYVHSCSAYPLGDMELLLDIPHDL